jgi:glutamyl-tRNA synthetase
MDWTDPATGSTTKGFKERGFLPEAFVNMLAMLGWNDGSGQEIFSIDGLIEKFSIERIHKGGACFDYEKAKWFNHSWIQQLPVQHYAAEVKKYFSAAGITITHNDYLYRVMVLVKERCHLLPDFVEQAVFFFQHPTNVDTNAIAAKWNEAKQQFFVELMCNLELMSIWNAESLENDFKEMAAGHQLKPGELMLRFRIMLVGGKFGPQVFDIADLIGKVATIQRIKHTLQLSTA